jgi:hypothetical protein
LFVGNAMAFGAAAAVLIVGLASRQGPLLLWAGVAVVLAVVYLYGTVSSARARTRFGALGFRTRGLWGWADQYSWDQIANVAVQQVFYPSRYRTGVVYFVVATTKAGDHVRLGAPVSGVADAHFIRQFRQIRQCWQHTTGIGSTPETTSPTRAAGAVWLGGAVGVQVLALVVIAAAMPHFAGVAAGTGVVLLVFASEVLVPIYRRRTRHRRAAMSIARPPQSSSARRRSPTS